MRVLFVTDAFPPRCGGSGWSTYELAKALRARGHGVLIAQPRLSGSLAARRPLERAEYDGFRPLVFSQWAPAVPVVRNYFGNERLYGRFGAWLARVVRTERVDLLHAQHLRSGPAAVRAAGRTGVPVVCTIRDYWPVCYWSDLLYDAAADALCPGCSAGMMTRCVRPHAKAFWPVALAAIPYMQANLAVKRRALAAADAIVAVSQALARELRARAPELAGSRWEVVPNPVDAGAIRAQAERQPRPMSEPYAVFVGKLESNKGVMKLVPALAQAELDWPLVIVGDGSERAALARAFAAQGREVRFTGWRPRDEVLAWVRHAEFLVFPSRGPESLSRVLLEASALGVPAAALDTGGTSEIVVPEETGLLARSVDELGRAIARLRREPALRQRLGAAARRRVDTIFEAGNVASRMEALYEDLRRAGPRHRAGRGDKDRPGES